MKKLTGQLLELTFTAIIVFLLLSNAFGFTSVISALADAYTQGVTALQGRSPS